MAVTRGEMAGSRLTGRRVAPKAGCRVWSRARDRPERAPAPGRRGGDLHRLPRRHGRFRPGAPALELDPVAAHGGTVDPRPLAGGRERLPACRSAADARRRRFDALAAAVPRAPVGGRQPRPAPAPPRRGEGAAGGPPRYGSRDRGRGSHRVQLGHRARGAGPPGRTAAARASRGGPQHGSTPRGPGAALARRGPRVPRPRPGRGGGAVRRPARGAQGPAHRDHAPYVVPASREPR